MSVNCSQYNGYSEKASYSSPEKSERVTHFGKVARKHRSQIFLRQLNSIYKTSCCSVNLVKTGYNTLKTSAIRNLRKRYNPSEQSCIILQKIVVIRILQKRCDLSNRKRSLLHFVILHTMYQEFFQNFFSNVFSTF